MPSWLLPSVRTASSRPSSRIRYHRLPSVHNGPPKSAGCGQSSVSSPSTVTRHRFHHPLRSVIAYRLPSSTHSGCSTASEEEPSNRCHSPQVPSAPSVPTRNSAPSHGICGWFQQIQAIRLPSGEIRAWPRKLVPPRIDRITAGFSAPEPSSGTAHKSRVMEPSSACASRTHQISLASGDNCGSAYRQSSFGVSGTGSTVPDASRYSR